MPGKLIVDLPHTDPESGRKVQGVDLYYEDGTTLDNVADFAPDEDGKGLWVMTKDPGHSTEWTLIEDYEVRNGEIRPDHNTFEDWN